MQGDSPASSTSRRFSEPQCPPHTSLAPSGLIYAPNDRLRYYLAAREGRGARTAQGCGPFHTLHIRLRRRTGVLGDEEAPRQGGVGHAVRLEAALQLLLAVESKLSDARVLRVRQLHVRREVGASRLACVPTWAAQRVAACLLVCRRELEARHGRQLHQDVAWGSPLAGVTAQGQLVRSQPGVACGSSTHPLQYGSCDIACPLHRLACMCTWVWVCVRVMCACVDVLMAVACVPPPCATAATCIP